MTSCLLILVVTESKLKRLNVIWLLGAYDFV